MEQAVLIACTMNAVRSPMAAAILRHLQVRFDAGQQLARTEGLDQIIVGARVHALDTWAFASARREENNGDLS